MTPSLSSLSVLFTLIMTQVSFANPMVDRSVLDLDGSETDLEADDSVIFPRGSISFGVRGTMMKTQNSIVQRSTNAQAVGEFFAKKVDRFESVVQVQLEPIAFGDSWNFDIENHRFLPLQMEISYQLNKPGQDPMLQGPKEQQINNIVRLFRSALYQADLIDEDYQAIGIRLAEFQYENNPYLKSSTRTVSPIGLTLTRIISAKREETEGKVKWSVSGNIRPGSFSFDRIDQGILEDGLRNAGYEVDELRTNQMGREYITYRPTASFELASYLFKRARLSVGMQYSYGGGKGRCTRSNDEPDDDCPLYQSNIQNNYNAPTDRWGESLRTSVLSSPEDIKIRSHKVDLNLSANVDVWRLRNGSGAFALSAAIHKRLLDRIEINGTSADGEQVSSVVNRTPLMIDLGVNFRFK
tara:strand:- start:1252 stop:2484 length:1233 start_codon:yes stop_codon:yes gene_type:complete